jgi:replicative DNA helicase
MGFRDLDGRLRDVMDPRGGFKLGQLVVVGARPAMGKTGFGMSLLEAADADGLGFNDDAAGNGRRGTRETNSELGAAMA